MRACNYLWSESASEKYFWRAVSILRKTKWHQLFNGFSDTAICIENNNEFFLWNEKYQNVIRFRNYMKANSGDVEGLLFRRHRLITSSVTANENRSLNFNQSNKSTISKTLIHKTSDRDLTKQRFCTTFYGNNAVDVLPGSISTKKLTRRLEIDRCLLRNCGNHSSLKYRAASIENNLNDQ